MECTDASCVARAWVHPENNAGAETRHVRHVLRRSVVVYKGNVKRAVSP